MKAEALNSPDEALVVKQCKENNPIAQKIIYSSYVEGMMMLCLRYVVNHEDAREVLMDSFLSFFKNIHGFTYMGAGSTKAWLKKIVVNQCLMHLRKRSSFIVTGKETEYLESIDGSGNVLEYLSAKEILQLVHALPDGYRTVFNLYFFEGMNHREIGEILGISENTSKSQLHRARTILKDKLAKVY